MERDETLIYQARPLPACSLLLFKRRLDLCSSSLFLAGQITSPLNRHLARVLARKVEVLAL
jgi:hypothetical protein